MENFSFNDFLEKLNSHAELRERSTTKTYPKGTYVFQQGEVCRDVFCMHKGLVKLFYNTFEGKEWIKSFIPDTGVFGSRRSQVLGEASPFSVLCLEDSEITQYPFDIFERVCLNDEELSRSLFAFTQWLGLKKEIREYRLLCLSAEEAYSDFVAENSKLVNRITQIDIARYLGITPIALSRIKKRI